MQKHASILFVAPFNHDHGTEKITFNVVRAACEQYSDVALLYAGGKGELFRELSRTVDMLFGIGNQDRRANVYRNALYIAAKIYILRPRTMFVVNHVMGMSAGLALRLLYGSIRPFSILAHHVYPQQRGDSMEMRRMMQWFRMFDRHVVVSSSMADALKPYLGGRANVIECIPNAIDANEIRRTIQSGSVNISLPTHRWRCIYVGGLRVDKRVDRLVRAFAMLPERNETVLLLVGDGNARPQLEVLADDLGVRERCVFVGHQSCPFAWYHECDLFVQTPDWETFGLSVLEAMAAGLPVLTMGDNSPGLQELVHDGVNGRLIASGDIGEFAQAWSKLLGDPVQRKAMVLAGVETAKQYSLDAMSSQYMRLFSLCS